MDPYANPSATPLGRYQPPAPNQASPPAPQTHQYGYGHGFDNYVYGGGQASPATAPQASPATAPQPSPAPAPAAPGPGPGPAQYFNQPKLSLSSFSSKKTSAWLKKNVSPRLDNVARSSFVQGGMKELSNAYTTAKGVADNYSAKYYAAQAQQQQQLQGASHSSAMPPAQSPAPWNPAQQSSPGQYSASPPAGQPTWSASSFAAPPVHHSQASPGGQPPLASGQSVPPLQPAWSAPGVAAAPTWDHQSQASLVGQPSSASDQSARPPLQPAWSAPSPAAAPTWDQRQAQAILVQGHPPSSDPSGRPPLQTWSASSLAAPPGDEHHAQASTVGQPSAASDKSARPTLQPALSAPSPAAPTWDQHYAQAIPVHGQPSSSDTSGHPPLQPTWSAPSPAAASQQAQANPEGQLRSAWDQSGQPTWSTSSPPAAPAWEHQHGHPPLASLAGQPPPASSHTGQPTWATPSPPPMSWHHHVTQPSQGQPASLPSPPSSTPDSQAPPSRKPIARKPISAPRQTGETIRPIETTDGSTAYLVINHDSQQATRVVTSPDGGRTFVQEAYPGPDAPEAPQPATPLEAPQAQAASPVKVPQGRASDPLYDPSALSTPIGTPSTALRLCPRPRTVSYATTWYHLKGLPDFDICSFCYSKHITSLTHEFESVVKANGLCRFSVPRVTKSLWPEAQRTSSITALRDFASRRTAIPACTKKGGAVGTDGVKWFGLAGGEIGMVACEACHEDEVAGTSFAGRFEPLKQVQGASERWICTISYEHVSRSLQVYSTQNAWSEFVVAVKKRMALPDCSDTLASATGRNWYRPIRPVGDIDICEACYLDNLALTDLGGHFAETGESFEQKLTMRICDFQLMNLSEALVVCRTKGLGIDAFLRAAAKIASSPRCSKQGGIVDGRFYNFASTPAANFGICEGCHAGILEPHGVAPFFTPQPQLVQGTAWCAFNPSVERFGGLVNHWLEAVETGSWPAYERWVCRYTALPTCPNFNMAAGRRWYGWDDLPVCPECYETVAEGTPLAASFELRDTPVEGERLCAGYSEHMRGRWAKASAAGDAKGLREFNAYRMSVYAQTVPRFKMLAQMQTMQNQLALSQMMLGLSLQHANAMSDWGGSSGYEYGNSSLGYHSSQYGVDSAKAFDEGRATMARANGPIAEASYLKDAWQVVE